MYTHVDFKLGFVSEINHAEAIGPTPRVDVTWTRSKGERSWYGTEYVAVADRATFGPGSRKDKCK